MGVMKCLSQGGLRCQSASSITKYFDRDSIIYSLAKESYAPLVKEVMVSVALVCLSVCLFVDVTQQVINGLG